MSQVGIILDGVPVAVVEALPSFRQFADTELRFQLAKALDAHLYTKVNTGASFGNTGTNLIAQLRNAVAALQAAGYNPDLAIVNPADAVALDLTTTGADAQYVFALRDTGDSSPLWGLRVVVRAGTTGTEPPWSSTPAASGRCTSAPWPSTSTPTPGSVGRISRRIWWISGPNRTP
jgi:hypothetical protein